MGLMDCLLIVIGVIAVAFLLVTIVRRVSTYYRQRYNMSVWAGVFMLVIATVLVAFSVYHYQEPNIPLVVAAGVFLLLTGFLDIRHAGIGMGLVALLFQTVLAVGFIVVIIVVVVLYIIKAVKRGDDILLDAVTGTTSGFRNKARLFFHFFVP